jgi:hypothetical protein
MHRHGDAERTEIEPEGIQSIILITRNLNGKKCV